MSSKSILIINSLLVGMSFNYICFNQNLPGLFFGLFGISLVFYKYHKVLNYKSILNITIINYILMVMMLMASGLINCNRFMFLAGFLVSLNAAIWFNVLEYVNDMELEGLQNIFTYLLLGFYLFVLIIIISPDQYLNYFLYPQYLDGGFKVAMVVICFVIFMPNVINNALISIFKYKLVKSKLITKY